MSFKHKVIEYYSGWAAFNSVFTAYMEQIEETQQDLYKYITENPTCEESKKIFPDILEKFMGDLRRDQKALEERERQAQEEILALTKGQ